MHGRIQGKQISRYIHPWEFSAWSAWYKEGVKQSNESIGCTEGFKGRVFLSRVSCWVGGDKQTGDLYVSAECY